MPDSYVETNAFLRNKDFKSATATDVPERTITAIRESFSIV